MKSPGQSGAEAPGRNSGRQAIRCAIYTRKSTEEGLDQAFNSLDAQREACAAYIMSQIGEGWTLVPTLYDDGGYSGGSMDRPGLQRLLADIGRGLVDIVVVYKIDRLTRSLADFAKIVERLDARGASFVSVTQAFNTTTSMGRLTLNVLLSFAQFEREVGAERVRDKIAASRKKGIWMGGNPPLGYDVRDRKLIVNEAEAETIRWMFSRYLELRSILQLKTEIEARGIRTKTFIARTGRHVGSKRWYIGPLRHLLRNRVYVGEAVHKENAYPGEHSAIVDRATFAAVQAALDDSAVARRERVIRRSPGLLTGLVFDDAGNAMTPQATSKPTMGTRLVYYVSQAVLQRRDPRGTLPRVSAKRLEGLVAEVLPLAIDAAARGATRRQRGQAMPEPLDPARSAIRIHIQRITVSREQIVLDLAGLGVANDLERVGDEIEAVLSPHFADIGVEVLEGAIRLTLPVSLAPHSTASRVERSTGWTARKTHRDLALIRALVLAHRWKRDLEAARLKSVEAVGTSAGLDRNSARYMVRLALLAPELQIAILDGHQPPSLTVRQILNTVIPPDWESQRAMFDAAASTARRR
jgi:DNA invertase Pin-like site-specific DNA recombinase